jgi:hypothetical protein
MLRVGLFGTAFFDDEYVVDPYVVKLRSKTKSLIEGQMFGPHLVEILHDKVLQQGAYVWTTYLVEVCSETKSFDKGHIFGPHLVKVRSETKSSKEGHILDHSWSKSAA